MSKQINIQLQDSSHQQQQESSYDTQQITSTLIKIHISHPPTIGQKTYEISSKDTISDLRSNVIETTQLFMYDNYQFILMMDDKVSGNDEQSTNENYKINSGNLKSYRNNSNANHKNNHNKNYKVLNQFIPINQIIPSSEVNLSIKFNPYDERSSRFHYGRVKKILENPFLLVSQNVKSIGWKNEVGLGVGGGGTGYGEQIWDGINSTANIGNTLFPQGSLNDSSNANKGYDDSDVQPPLQQSQIARSLEQFIECLSKEQLMTPVDEMDRQKKQEQENTQSTTLQFTLSDRLTLSGYNPVPYYRKTAGDFFYIEFRAAQGVNYHITAHTEGYFLNQSTNTVFNPSKVGDNSNGSNIREKSRLQSQQSQQFQHPHHTHASLLKLLCGLSPKLKQGLRQSIVRDNKKWTMTLGMGLGGTQLLTPQESLSTNWTFKKTDWMVKVPKKAAWAKPKEEKEKQRVGQGRTPTSANTSASKPNSISSPNSLPPHSHNSLPPPPRQQTLAIKDWNQMFQIQHQEPSDSFIEKINREKLKFKIYQEFIENVKLGVEKIMKKEILPQNPNCPKEKQTFVYSNLYLEFVENSFTEEELRCLLQQGGDQSNNKNRNLSGIDINTPHPRPNAKKINNYITNLQHIQNHLSSSPLIASSVHLSHSILVQYKGHRIRCSVYPSLLLHTKLPSQAIQCTIQRKNIFKNPLPIQKYQEYQDCLLKVCFKLGLQFENVIRMGEEQKNRLKKINLDNRVYGLQTMDMRKYLFCLERLSPRDFNYVKRGEELEKMGKKVKDSSKTHHQNVSPYEFHIIRPQAIDLYNQKYPKQSKISINTMLGWDSHTQPQYKLFPTQKTRQQQSKLKSIGLFTTTYIINSVIAQLSMGVRGTSTPVHTSNSSFNNPLPHHLADTRVIIQIMHKNGLNSRYLGLLYQKVNKKKLPHLALALEKVIYVKSVKNVLNVALKGSSNRIREVTAHFLNCLFKSESVVIEDSWAHLLFGEEAEQGNQLCNDNEDGGIQGNSNGNRQKINRNGNNSSSSNSKRKKKKAQKKGEKAAKLLQSPTKIQTTSTTSSVISNYKNQQQQHQQNHMAQKKQSRSQSQRNKADSSTSLPSSLLFSTIPPIELPKEQSSQFFLTITPHQLSRLISKVAKLKYGHQFVTAVSTMTANSDNQANTNGSNNVEKKNIPLSSSMCIHPKIFDVKYGRYSVLRDICLHTGIVLERLDYFGTQAVTTPIIKFLPQHIISFNQKITHILPTGDMKQINKLINQGDIFFSQFLIEQAIDSYNKAIQYILTTFGGNSDKLPLLHKKLSYIYFKIGDIDTAIIFASHALSMLSEEFYDYEHPQTIDSLVVLSIYHTAKRSFKQAQQFMFKAIYYATLAFGEGYPELLSMWMDLATIYEIQKMYCQSIMCLYEGLRICKEVYDDKDSGNKDGPQPKQHLNTAVYFTALAVLHFEIPDIRQAIRFSQKALTALKGLGLGQNDPRVKQSKQMLQYYMLLQSSKKIKDVHEKQQRKMNNFLMSAANGFNNMAMGGGRNGMIPGIGAGMNIGRGMGMGNIGFPSANNSMKNFFPSLIPNIPSLSIPTISSKAKTNNISTSQHIKFMRQDDLWRRNMGRGGKGSKGNGKKTPNMGLELGKGMGTGMGLALG